ncbi:conjugation TrbI-like protein [Sphingobium faniae]|nr:conjugation TrbI-like protein [Sphingobium faniae]
MSENEKSAADGGPKSDLTFEEAKGRLTYDESEVQDDVLKDANSTRPEFDRKAFNPRGRLQSMGKGMTAAIAIGAAFVGFMVYSMASQSQKAEKPNDTTFKLDDASAEHSARQAAQVVVRPDKPGQGMQQVGTDPFGNPIMADGGQDLSGGITVPAPTGAQGGRGDPAMERAEQMRRERMAALQREKARQDAMRRAPIMAISGSMSGQAGAGPQGGNGGPFSHLRVGGADAGGESQGGEGGGEPNALQRQLKGMDIQQVSAGRLPNRNFLITAGMQIPCVLQTAMDSTQPGLTSCVVPQDIWSNNGNVILMEKGTRVLGEYQGGFSTGQHRIFVLWNRAITPSGISVSLGSPAADQLGRAGMGGKIDTFFWQRFGAALLLSIVGDAGDALSNSVSGVDETIDTPNTAAAIAAQDSQRIRPRLRAPQGREMTIMVARDVDFSNVYSLRLRP